MEIIKTLWGHHNGQEVYLLTITNGYLELSLSNFGCTIVSVMVPADGDRLNNIVLGYDSLRAYVNDPYYMGCIVGRFANRISNACFNIEETKYQLEANETKTGNHLHGGNIGFNKKVFFISDTSINTKESTVQFYYKSPDGEEGYPGNLDVFITYSLTDKNEMIIDYEASTDKTTPVNLTSHCYFNLSNSKANATDHELFINADSVLVADDNYIPTGDIKPVKGTNLDFTTFRRIDNKENKFFDGYNDCFLLNHSKSDMNVKAALRDPESGITMSVKTTLPGVILYTGDYLGAPFKKNQGICLEAQFFPDSVNQPHFPQTLLHPGDLYQHKTVYQFFN